MPKLFPYAEITRWTKLPIYEHPEILTLKATIETIEKETEKRIRLLEEEINTVDSKWEFLHELITEAHEELVVAVKKTLELLGFQKVTNVDEEKELAGDTSWKDEDLRIDDYSPILLVEVKGVGGVPSDADILQVDKHTSTRMRELGRTDIYCLFIINHQRYLPPTERSQPFREAILTHARERKIGLLTTWDLFRLARSYLRNNWKHEYIKDVFYRHGQIKPIPIHYQHIGFIEEYYKQPKAIVFELEGTDISVGDFIAFELINEFVEQKIESLMLDDVVVEKIEQGKVAGVKVDFEAKKGVKVFKVTK